jgi:PAS domain S-box-containing protein
MADDALKYHLNNLISNTKLYSIIATDLQGRIIFFNKGAQDLFKYAEDEVVGKKHLSDFIDKHTPKAEFAAFLSNVAEKGSYGRDLPMLMKNKKQVMARFRLAPITDNAQPIGFVAFARDLQTGKKVQDDIANVRHELEMLFDSIPENIFVVDRNYRIKRSNKALLDYSSRKDFSEVLNQKCHSIFHKNCKDCGNCPAKATFETGQPASKIFSVNRDGKIRFKELHSFPIRSASGEIAEVVLHSKDITKRILLENKLMRQNSRLILIQEIGDSMHSSEHLNEVLDTILSSILKLGFNRAALYLISKADNMLKGVMSIGFKKDVVKDISMELARNKNDLISKVLAGKKPVFAKNIFDPNNRFYVPEEWFKTFEGDSILAIPLIIEGEAIGMLTVDMRDKDMEIDDDDLRILELFASDAAIAISRATLNERLDSFNEKLKKKIKEATIELSLKNRRLEELDRMKNQFLSTISHELKTPLTSIQGYSAILKAEKLGALNQEQRKSIEILNSEALRLNELITTLLDLTKLETGRARLQLAETDVNELAESVILSMKASAEKKKIEIQFKPAKLEKIKLDPSLIELALKNLISNSIKYNKENGRIYVSLSDDDSRILFEVRDTGRGISRDKISQIFKKFHQLDEHTIRYEGGTGIGLAIVKSIIDKHNGVIKIDSEAGKGTRIFFTLPKNLIVESEEEDSYRLKRTIDELRSIRSIFNIMHSEKSLDEVLQQILEEIHKTIGFDRIRLYLLDRNNKYLKGAVAIGTPNIQNYTTLISKIKSSRLVKSIFESRQAEIIEMSEKHHLADEGFEPAKKLAVMPLLVKKSVIGMIVADNLYSKKEITPEDLKSLTIFANSAAICIENFRLYDETEQKVRQRTKQLTKLNKQKDEFLSYVSHEMRTPLTSLLGYSKLILSKKLDKKTTEESIKIIHSESERLKNMIDNFLDLSKIEAGKIRLEKTEVDLREAAEKVMAIVRKQADDKGLGLSMEVQGDTKVICDRDKIEQVMLNLLSNGIKFTQKGSVKIILRSRKKNVELEVKDTGIGIAKKDYNRVFSKFEQVKNQSTQQKGTGLGLHIAKQIVELHNGRIWVESAVGKGSSFFVVLPRVV